LFKRLLQNGPICFLIQRHLELFCFDLLYCSWRLVMESLSVEVKFEVRGKLDTVPWLPNLGSSKFMSEIISN